MYYDSVIWKINPGKTTWKGRSSIFICLGLCTSDAVNMNCFASNCSVHICFRSFFGATCINQDCSTIVQRKQDSLNEIVKRRSMLFFIALLLLRNAMLSLECIFLGYKKLWIFGARK